MIKMRFFVLFVILGLGKGIIGQNITNSVLNRSNDMLPMYPIMVAGKGTEEEELSEDPRLVEEISLDEISVGAQRNDLPPECRNICPPQTVEVGDRCYRYIEKTTIWEDAKKDCEGQGGFLAIPDFSYNDTAVDLSAVYRNIIGRTLIWIGASDSYSNHWKWVNGSALSVDHPNWYPGHPGDTNYCASIYKMVRGPLQIQKRNCAERRYFLCQFDLLNVSR